MTEEQACALATDYAVANLPDLGERPWRTMDFSGGWLLTPEGDDIKWTFGIVRLIVLDDGSIHETRLSIPPSDIIKPYITGAE